MSKKNIDRCPSESTCHIVNHWKRVANKKDNRIKELEEENRELRGALDKINRTMNRNLTEINKIKKSTNCYKR